MNKPSIPKGTRDFLPREMIRRKYLFDTIEKGFQNAGFLPIETPAMENTSTLMGKYGEEGDRLIFKVLNSGDFLKKVKNENKDLKDLEPLSLAPRIAEKALRYDLTVPFARFVVQHQHEITFPFKRYQIQPVWRADRPQKGRYREFYQCDADVIGSNSLWNEVELTRIFDNVLTTLGIPSFSIHINNRKILSGVAEAVGHPDKFGDLTVALDKLDKIGKDKVEEELKEKGFDAGSIEKLDPLFSSMKSTNHTKLMVLSRMLKDSEEGMKGIDEVTTVMDNVEKLGTGNGKLVLSPTLARGLDYYTGAIFEVTVDDVDMGSICGGGRYDDLTGIFGLKDVSGVGISFGAERIYDVLDALDLFPDSHESATQVLFLNFSRNEVFESMKLAEGLRAAGFNAEVYPDKVKLKKQMKYADQNGIPIVAMIGEEERKNQQVKVKDMESGEEELISSDGLEEEVDKVLSKKQKSAGHA